MSPDIKPPNANYRVTRKGCWLWLGATESNGAGRTSYRGRRMVAHRAYYEHYIGEIPASMVVAQACSQPSCVNPACLRLVTWQQRCAPPEFGPLSATQFDTLELVKIMGGVVRTIDIAERNNEESDTVAARLRRLVAADLLTVRTEAVSGEGNVTRRSVYEISVTGWTLYREALASIDAALMEEAA